MPLQSRFFSALFAFAFAGLVGCIRPEADSEITLNLMYADCTGCLDALVLNDLSYIPDSIRRKSYDFDSDVLILRGKNPFRRNWIESQFAADGGQYFQVKGRFIGIDRNNGVGSVPVFFVHTYHKIDSAQAFLEFRAPLYGSNASLH